MSDSWRELLRPRWWPGVQHQPDLPVRRGAFVPRKAAAATERVSADSEVALNVPEEETTAAS